MTHFDPARIRHNFERACGPMAPSLPPRVSRVNQPRDARVEARRLLDGIMALSKQRYAEHWPALQPFFTEAERLLAALEAAAEPPAATLTSASDASEPAASELREELRAVLRDIEDLLEVFAEVGFG
ncbi:MAG: hypothetical protein ACOY0T_20205 [Myxococcota bacterium]